MKEIKKSFLHVDLGIMVLVTVDNEIYLPVGYSGRFICKADFEKGDNVAGMTKGAKEDIKKLFDTKFIR